MQHAFEVADDIVVPDPNHSVTEQIEVSVPAPIGCAVGVLPAQNDHVTIPLDCNNVPKGEYQIVDACSDGGGSTMLTIRKYETFE